MKLRLWPEESKIIIFYNGNKLSIITITKKATKDIV